MERWRQSVPCAPTKLQRIDVNVLRDITQPAFLAEQTVSKIVCVGPCCTHPPLAKYARNGAPRFLDERGPPGGRALETLKHSFAPPLPKIVSIIEKLLTSDFGQPPVGYDFLTGVCGLPTTFPIRGQCRVSPFENGFVRIRAERHGANYPAAWIIILIFECQDLVWGLFRFDPLD